MGTVRPSLPPCGRAGQGAAATGAPRPADTPGERVVRAGWKRPRRLAVVACAVLGVAMATGGCGGEDAVLSAGQQGRLLAHLDDARGAVGEDDRPGARSALGELERQVRRLADDGVLDEDQAAALLAAVERATARVDDELPPPPVDEPGRGPVPRESGQEPPGVPPEGDDAEVEDDEKDDKQERKEDKEEREDDKDEKDDKGEKGEDGD